MSYDWLLLIPMTAKPHFCAIILVQWNLRIKGTFGTNRFVFCREAVLFQRLISIGSVYNGTFSLSFVGRFVLFQSVLYQRFHCIHTKVHTVIKKKQTQNHLFLLVFMEPAMMASCDFGWGLVGGSFEVLGLLSGPLVLLLLSPLLLATVSGVVGVVEWDEALVTSLSSWSLATASCTRTFVR